MDRKGIVILTSVELIQVVLKEAEAKMREDEAAAKSRNI